MESTNLIRLLILLSNLRKATCLLQVKNNDNRQHEHLAMKIIGQHVAFFKVWCFQLITKGNSSEIITQVLYRYEDKPIVRARNDVCKVIIIVCDKEEEILDERVDLTTEFTVIIIVFGVINLTFENPEMFGDADVIIITRQKLYRVEVFSDCRRFVDIYNRGSVLSNPGSVVKDFKGRTLRVGTFTCPPFSYLPSGDVHSDGNNTQNGILDGIEMLAFLELSKRLNFTWKIQQPSDKNKWGRLEQGIWSGGVLGWLANGSTDVAFCALWVVAEQRETADFTVPWNQLCNTFLVPRPGIKMSWNAIFRSLELPVWVVFGCLVVITSMMLCLIARLQNLISSAVKLRKYEVYSSSLLEIVGMLVLASSPPAESNLEAARHVFCWWSMFTLLATTAYSSGLVSHLTVPLTTRAVDSVQDLVNADFFWGQSYFPSVDSIFDLSNYWHKKFIERYKEETDPQYQNIMKENKHAFFGYKLEGSVRYFLETEEVYPETWKRYRVMKECMSRYHIALGLAKNSPYTEAFNAALRRLQEAGIMEYWQRDVINRRGNRNVTSLFHKETSGSPEPEKLSLKQIEGAFLLFFAGMVVSTLAYTMERYWNRIRYVFHSVRGNPYLAKPDVICTEDVESLQENKIISNTSAADGAKE